MCNSAHRRIHRCTARVLRQGGRQKRSSVCYATEPQLTLFAACGRVGAGTMGDAASTPEWCARYIQPRKLLSKQWDAHKNSCARPHCSPAAQNVKPLTQWVLQVEVNGSHVQCSVPAPAKAERSNKQQAIGTKKDFVRCCDPPTMGCSMIACCQMQHH
jgi:hypothetical protein